jgi:GT2 family glycosyltransferase
MVELKGPVWIGQIELSGAAGLQSLVTDLTARHATARVLIRIHGVPIGQVVISPLSLASLESDARSQAHRTFESEIREHLAADGIHPGDDLSSTLLRATACRRYHVEPADAPSISVAICTRDRHEELRRCLRSIRALQYSGRFEVLVVDNSPEGQSRVERDHQARVPSDIPIRYIAEPSGGISVARNRALREAIFDWVAFTDDDGIVDPKWLESIARGILRSPEVACVTGLVLSGSVDSQSERFFDMSYSSRDYHPKLFGKKRSPEKSYLYPFNAGVFGSGANFAVDRRVVEGLGGFDRLLGIGGPLGGGEDLDLFLRVILSGHQIAREPAAIVWHFHVAADEDFDHRLVAWYRGLGGYIAKQLLTTTTRRLAWLRAAHGLVHLLGLLLRTDKSKHRGLSVLVPGSLAGSLKDTASGMIGYWRLRRKQKSRSGML